MSKPKIVLRRRKVETAKKPEAPDLIQIGNFSALKIEVDPKDNVIQVQKFYRTSAEDSQWARAKGGFVVVREPKTVRAIIRALREALED